MKTQVKKPRQRPTQNPAEGKLHLTRRRKLKRLVKKVKETSKMVKISLNVPSRHYDVIKEVANMLHCTPEAVFQRALNHALKGNTLGHVVESMLGEKYRDVFNNNHNLDLS